MTNFSLVEIFSDFSSSGLTKDELEELIKEAVKKDNKLVKNIEYYKNGVKVFLDDNEVLEIEIDWNEIILK